MTRKHKGPALEVERLHDLILPDLRQLAGPQARWKIQGPVVRAREGDIYKAEAGSFPHALALKLYRPEIRPLKGQKSEFEALSYIQPLLAAESPELAVPKAYFYAESPGLIAMEWIEAVSIRKLLWRSLPRPAHRLALIARAGHFISRFHAVSGLQSKKVQPQRYLTILQRRIKTSETGQRLLEEQRLFAEGLELLKETRGFLKSCPIPIALGHGDLTPSNLLMSKERTFAIDLTSIQRRPIYEDISKLLTYFISDYPFVPTMDKKKIAGLRRREWEAFWRHGEAPAPGAPFQVFLHIHLHRLLRRWIKIEERTFSHSSFALKRAIRNLIDGYEKNAWQE